MKIKFIQNIIDILRRKDAKNRNNLVLCQVDDKLYPIRNLGKNCSIKGCNNKIIFKTNKRIAKFPSGLKFVLNGNNNYVEIQEPNFINSELYISLDDNKFTMKKTDKSVHGAFICLAHGSEIEIEKDCELGNRKLMIIVNGDYKTKHKLFIGEGTHIATDAIIRTSDGECLVDWETNKPLSEPQDIYIGKHCWITSRCTILKGAYLPDNTIVAANSVINKKFDEEYTLLAGVPAVIKKRNVKWVKDSYCDNMLKWEQGQKNKN